MEFQEFSYSWSQISLPHPRGLDKSASCEAKKCWHWISDGSFWWQSRKIAYYERNTRSFTNGPLQLRYKVGEQISGITQCPWWECSVHLNLYMSRISAQFFRLLPAQLSLFLNTSNLEEFRVVVVPPIMIFGCQSSFIRGSIGDFRAEHVQQHSRKCEATVRFSLLSER